MRKIRYMVAMSLDGHIAGPKGEIDWIVPDPSIDFGAILAQFDTLLIGRRTFDEMVEAGRAEVPGMKIFVFSRTLKQRDFPKATIVSGDQVKTVTDLRSKSGKDIWLFGGGSLFASLLVDRLVDTVEVAVMPALLGGGVPLLPAPGKRAKLRLANQSISPIGIAHLTYEVA